MVNNVHLAHDVLDTILWKFTYDGSIVLQRLTYCNMRDLSQQTQCFDLEGLGSFDVRFKLG
jgi:hypothetical protein